MISMIPRKKHVLTFLIAALFIITTFNILLASEDASTAGFLRFPDIHGNKVLFSTSSDLWTVDVKGGVATRLTTHDGEERFAKFSPDGKLIAFSGDYYGDPHIFIIPATGGEPFQLTFQPGREQVVGWDKEGNVIFRRRDALPNRGWALYKVSAEGGFPEKLPFTHAAYLEYEPDGKRVAMVPTYLAFHNWKRYQGGEVEKIWVGDMNKPDFQKIENWKGNESFPMWANNGRIYHISDSTGRGNIWSMMPDGSDLRQETKLDTFDIRWPSLDGNNIIFMYGLDLKIYNIKNQKITSIDITVPSDLHVTRTKFIDPNPYVKSWDVDKEGKRLLVSARGEIFTLPLKTSGLMRQWTFTSGSNEKLVNFLPGDEEKIITVTDQNGEERIAQLDKPGGKLQEIEKNAEDGWTWFIEASPDGKYIAHADQTHQLYILDVETGKNKIVDKSQFDITEFCWSPDSRYIAYVNTGEPSTLSTWIYDTKTGKKHLACDPHFSTFSPSWDPDGKYLYVITERNFNGYQDYDRANFLYDNIGTLALIRLREDVLSPFLAHGDRPEKDAIPEATWIKKEEEAESDEEEEKELAIKIDFDGLADRMVAIPEKPGNYAGIKAISGKFYYFSWIRSGITSGYDGEGDSSTRLKLYDLGKRESSEVASGVSSIELSGDNSTIVARARGNWYYGDAGSPSLDLGGDNQVSTSGWEMEVNPREEWPQMLRQVWRTQRDFFYVEDLHGVKWEEVYSYYAPLVDRLSTRYDLLQFIREIFSELHVGHAYTWGGDTPDVESANTGFLGADIIADKKSGYYKIEKIFNPEPGTHGGSSPLVHADPQTGKGTYILAIDGRKADANKNIFRLLQNKAGKEIALTLNEKPSFEGSREVIIKAIGTESWLRYLQWVHDTREYVSKKSGGKIGYVYLPDMSSEGLREWGRDYYPQRRLPGLIIDDRWNGGGNVSEYFTQILTSDVFAVQSARSGVRETKPHNAAVGHKAVLCNALTASDGETFAEATKRTGFGKLIGTRTWGGWVWIWPRWPLMDNGGLSVPEFGGWDLKGEWMIEGPGVYPEIEVENDPGSGIKGIDKQLDAAIEYLLQQIKEDPRILPERPEGPVKL